MYLGYIIIKRGMLYIVGYPVHETFDTNNIELRDETAGARDMHKKIRPSGLFCARVFIILLLRDMIYNL